jgi:ketosteroid isomerase-like protein
MRHLTAFFLLALLTSCKENKIDQKAEGEKLMQVSREWARTISPDSVDRVMSFWADSAIFLTSDAEPLYGKPAIRKMVEDSFKEPGFIKMNWQPVSASISESGDMGYLIEENQLTFNNDSTGKPMTLYGRAITIWKKDANGNWKNVVEVSVPDHAKNK